MANSDRVSGQADDVPQLELCSNKGDFINAIWTTYILSDIDATEPFIGETPAAGSSARGLGVAARAQHVDGHERRG
jgi:hypothetical protein